MRIKTWWVLPLVGAFLIAGVIFTPSHAQENVRYFPQTGHSIRGEFLDFYLSNPEATLLYGFPTTDDFKDIFGNQVQYFQKARFELDPKAPPGKRIKLSDLGNLVFQAERITAVPGMPINTPACSKYGAFYICDAFLDFFKKHGGPGQFGYPISSYSKEGDLYVQYFDRARFEYRPGLSSFDYVRLTDIGSVQFGLSGNDRHRLDPVIGTDYRVTSLKVSAFVKKALVRANDPQTLYVVVVDQLNNPVPNADVKVVWHLPENDQVLRDAINPTNVDGVSLFPYIIKGTVLPNQIYRIDVEVTYQGFKGSASTWYRSWW